MRRLAGTLEFDLSISADEYQKLYRGAASDVLARAVTGERVRFPARILRDWVAHDGVRGRFRILYDDQQRFVALERLQ